MSDETVHNVAIDYDTKTVVLTGRVLGQPYGVQVRVDQQEAAWADASLIPEARPLDPRRIERETKQSPCPGCEGGVRKLIRGGIGWAKEVLGLDRAPPAVAAQRRAICLSCPSGVYDFGICRDDWPDKAEKDQGCGCVLALKVLQASEACPHKHWKKHARR